METIYNFLHPILSAAPPFIILLGFLIFVHELGHFLVAKWCGVRVEVFSMGFGKKIFKYKKGDTTYCVSLIPLGGYVKMFGDEMGAEIAAEDKPFSFSHKKLWQRFAVVIAGPLMNFFFAILIFTVVALVGEDMRKPVVGDVVEDTTAYNDGFRSGDEILRVNSEPVKTWDNFQDKINQLANSKIKIEIHRDGWAQPLALQTTPTLKLNDNVLSLSEYTADIDGLSSVSQAAFLGVVPQSPAAVLGLKTGDRIVSVNTRPVLYFRELENLFVALQNQNVDLEVERGDEKSAKILKISGPLRSFSSLAAMGIEPSDLYLSKVIDESPAAAAGLQPGDRITTINQTVPKKWEDVLNSVKNFSGQGAVQIAVSRDGEEKKFDITPKMTSHMNHQGVEEKRFTIGIVPWVQNAPPPTVNVIAQSLPEAFFQGIKRTNDYTVMTVVSFLRLIQNRISPKNIGGVISIGQAASETFKMGVSQFLRLMGLISINLFIINLLPIPVLDGGHLLFYCIEGLRGAPVSMKKMEVAQQIGLVVLMSLMVLSLFNDFSRVFGW